MKKLLLLASILWLSSCGGGQDVDAPATTSSNKATLSSAVKVPSAEDQQRITIQDSNTIIIPSDMSPKVGDIFLIGPQAWKLISELTLTEEQAGKSEQRFRIAPPSSIRELFTSLIIDGTYNIESPGATFIPAPQTLPNSSPTKKTKSRKSSTDGKCANTLLDGSPANKCTLEWEDGATKGEIEITIGTNFDLKRWDAITSGGSGKVKFPYKAKGSLGIEKDFHLIKPIDGDACYSGRPTLLGTRAYLGQISIPITIPGPPPLLIEIAIPICLTFDTKASISGKILEIEDSGTIEVILTENQLPQAKKLETVSKISKHPSTSEIWGVKIDENDLTLQVLPFEASADVSLGFELGFEIKAYRAVALGLNFGVAGKALIEASGSAAVAQRLSSELGGIPFSQWGSGNPGFLCLSIGTEADIYVTAYGSLPAFALFIESPLKAKTLFETTFEGPKAQIGACDLRVPSSTSISATPGQANAGQPVRLTATVGWNPANENDRDIRQMWRNAPVTGTVDIFVNGVIPPSCRDLSLTSGKASCEVSCPSGSRSELSVRARYNGSTKTLRESFSAVETIICTQPPPAPPSNTFWRGSYVVEKCTQSPSGTWYWMDPCRPALPIDARSGAFYFDDQTSDVVFESRPSNSSEIRSVITAGWRSNSSTFSVSQPIALNLDTLGPGYVPRTIYETGTLSYVFTVTSRTDTELTGTFKATMKSGWFMSGAYSEWTAQETEATGRWGASRLNGQRPATEMGAAGFCVLIGGKSFGIQQMPVPGNCNPDLMPGWCGQWQEGLCKFGGP